MATDSLHELMIDGLRDIYNAEQQLVEALPKMATAAADPGLANAFRSHLQETEGHVNRVAEALRALGETVSGKKCEAMEGLIEEGSELLKQKGKIPDAVLDAGLIAAAQKVEHYETATYGTLIAWARTMHHGEVTELLEQTLEEEEKANDMLSDLAEGGINEMANAGAM
jgi:ferritin-like metal-binding protein YciE